MTDYSKITALYSRLSVGDEDRDGGESNSIQNQYYNSGGAFWLLRLPITKRLKRRFLPAFH